MSIKTYIVDDSNKLRNVSHRYVSAKTHSVKASNNIVGVKFADDVNDVYLDDPEHPAQQLLYKSITFGSNFESIPDRCCCKFVNLKSVYFAGDKITSIGNEAFSMCYALQDFTMMPSMKSIGLSAFSECRSLTSFTFPSVPVSVGNEAFYASGIQDISANFSSCGYRAFAECSSLLKAVVSGTLGSGMFAGCSALSAAIMTGSISIVPEKCFYNCKSLVSLGFADLKAI